MNFPPNSFPKKSALIPLLLFCCSQISLSQTTNETSVSASISPRRINVGETASLVIEIKNGNTRQLPSRITVQGLDIVRSGSRSSVTIKNGVRVEQNFNIYQLRAAASGRYTIPAIPIEINGKQYSTKPIEITVVKAKTDGLATEATSPYFGRFSIEKKEIYVNQIVPFDINIFSKGLNSITDINSPDLSHESFVIQKFVEAKRDGMKLNGIPYSFVGLPSNLFALKPGKHTLGPCRVVIATRDGSSRSVLGFFRVPQITQRTVETGTVQLVVKPLPEGAPASFSGGVGDFQFEGKPSTSSVSVGDPISMTFVVKGIGNFGALSAPAFSGATQKQLWKTYESNKTLDPKETSDGLTTGRCTFSQVIIPLKETTEIPAFELSYFDPEKAKYITLKTKAFPLSVSTDLAAANTTTIAFPSASELGDPSGAESKPSAQYSDILHIQTGQAKWQAYTAIVPGTQGGPWFYTFHFLCSLGFCTLLGIGLVRWLKSRKLDRAFEDFSPTFKDSLKSIPKAGTPKRAFYQAVSTSLALWKEEHDTAPEKVIQAIDKINEKCEAFLYTGNSADNEALSNAEAEEFTSILQKLPKK